MRLSLLVSALACVLLVPVPALSQPSQGGPSGAQYDQYGGPVPGVGGNAVHDAIVASDAIRASDEEAQAAGGDADTAAEPDAASAEAAVTESSAEAQDENASAGIAVTEDATAAQDETVSDLEKLPDTGGPSPLWFGAPLLCAGGILARRILP
jgi:hypothetical protein